MLARQLTPNGRAPNSESGLAPLTTPTFQHCGDESAPRSPALEGIRSALSDSGCYGVGLPYINLSFLVPIQPHNPIVLSVQLTWSNLVEPGLSGVDCRICPRRMHVTRSHWRTTPERPDSRSPGLTSGWSFLTIDL